MKKIFFTLVTIICILTSVANLVFADSTTLIEKVPFSEVVSLTEENKIENVTETDETLLITLSDKTLLTTNNTPEVKTYLTSKGLLQKNNIWTTILGGLGSFAKTFVSLFFPILCIFLILKVIANFIRKRQIKKFLEKEIPALDKYIKSCIEQEQEHNMQTPPFAPPHMSNMPPHTAPSGKVVKAKSNKPNVTLKDVEGLDELKEDIYRIIDYLKNPQKYADIGARAPKGVILYGPPGTGKTLIAKAIAGEANVSFLNAVGSDFCEKYVGVGAQRVRELYKKARNSAPCIVFIDEVDAVAGQRDGDGNGEDIRTTNALLSELDGFNSADGVITICATNRLDLLDSAFQRAGRFDLKLAVSLPDAEGREKILKLHAKNKKLHKNINFKELSEKTIGFSGADLEALLNESALLAASKDKKEITAEEVNDAFFKIIMKGNKKKNKDVEKTKRLIAWHEAGHTLATKLLTDDSVPSVTIVGSTSGAGGVTFRTPKEMTLHSKKYLENLIKVMYAGRAAEEIFLGSKEDITTGASQDIKQATNIIKEYIAHYGMGNSGMLDLSQFSRDYKDIFEEAKNLSTTFYADVLNTLTENKEILSNIANALYQKETLNEKEIDSMMNLDLAKA